MEPVAALQRLLTAADRAAALRQLSPADVNSALEWMLSEGRSRGLVDSGALLLLLVQRIDMALVDLDLAQQFRIAPSITEPILRERVLRRGEEVLGVSLDGGVADVLVQRTRVAARRLDNRGESLNHTAVVEAAVDVGGRLRCTYCGYWFRVEDIRESIRDALALDQMEFSSGLDALRSKDPWKPVVTKTNKGEVQRWTELEIEHRVPEAALGDSGPGNVTIACRWCNRGKMSHRSYAEAMPGLLAVSLGQLHSPWATMLVARAFYAVVSREGSCAQCRRAPTVTELTVSVPTNLAGLRRPWDATTMCYECRGSA